MNKSTTHSNALQIAQHKIELSNINNNKIGESHLQNTAIKIRRFKVLRLDNICGDTELNLHNQYHRHLMCNHLIQPRSPIEANHLHIDIFRLCHLLHYIHIHPMLYYIWLCIMHCG